MYQNVELPKVPVDQAKPFFYRYAKDKNNYQLLNCSQNRRGISQCIVKKIDKKAFPLCVTEMLSKPCFCDVLLCYFFKKRFDTFESNNDCGYEQQLQ